MKWLADSSIFLHTLDHAYLPTVTAKLFPHLHKGWCTCVYLANFKCLAEVRIEQENSLHPYKAFLLCSRKLIALIQVYIFTKSISQVYTGHWQYIQAATKVYSITRLWLSLWISPSLCALHHFPRRHVVYCRWQISHTAVYNEHISLSLADTMPHQPC